MGKRPTKVPEPMGQWFRGQYSAPDRKEKEAGVSNPVADNIGFDLEDSVLCHSFLLSSVQFLYLPCQGQLYSFSFSNLSKSFNGIIFLFQRVVALSN